MDLFYVKTLEKFVTVIEHKLTYNHPQEMINQKNKLFLSTAE